MIQYNTVQCDTIKTHKNTKYTITDTMQHRYKDYNTNTMRCPVSGQTYTGYCHTTEDKKTQR